jgi:hypothetical protein
MPWNVVRGSAPRAAASRTRRSRSAAAMGVEQADVAARGDGHVDDPAHVRYALGLVAVEQGFRGRAAQHRGDLPQGFCTSRMRLYVRSSDVSDYSPMLQLGEVSRRGVSSGWSFDSLVGSPASAASDEVSAKDNAIL